MDAVKTDYRDICTRYRDAIIGLAFMVFFALVIYFSKDIKLMILSSAVDARFWPRVVGIGGCLVSFILFVKGVFEGKHLKKETDSVPGETVLDVPASAAGQETRNLPVPSVPEGGVSAAKETLALIFLYILGLNTIGFIPMSIIYLFFQLAVLKPKEERNYLKIVIMAIELTAVIYICFRYGFSMILPPGILRGLL